MSLKIKGKLLQRYDAVQVSEKFKKREFVIELAEEINGNIYTNFAKMQLVQNKCDIIDRFNIGDTVEVDFNVRGTAYVDKKDGVTKYITNLDAWKVELVGQAAQSQQSNHSARPQQAVVSGNPIDDLPF